MKKLLPFTILLFSLSQSVFALDYQLFPDSNAAWQIRFWIGPGNPYVYYYYYMNSVNNDTTISGNIYGKLYIVQQGPDTAYIGALRENNNSQVFFCHKDSATDYLLYDYSKNVGDSVSVYGYGLMGPTGNIISLKVEYKDSVMLANKYQRYLQLSDGNNWIEGVGTNGGLLENQQLSVSGSNQLICMSYNDTTWAQGNYALGTCSLILENVKENTADNNFSIFPNPATNQLTIHTSSFKNEAVTVSVMNVMGQQTLPPAPLQGRGGSASIDVSGLAAGMYFLQLKGESGSVVKRFVKE